MGTKNRRRLGDLYIVGKELTFDDGSGDPITVFVRKLNPMEHEKALKRANAVRATMLSDYRDSDSEASRELAAEMEDFERDELITLLCEEERAKRRPVIEAEVEEREEWANEGYLEGLVDAWNDGLDQTYALDPEDPDAKRVHDEMDRLVDEVDKELDSWVEAYKKDLETISEDDLRKRAAESRKNLKVNSEWFTEFRRCELWLSVKEPDKKTNYFQSREEVEGLPLEVVGRLVAEYKALAMEPLEGKDLGAQEDSSASSD